MKNLKNPAGGLPYGSQVKNPPVNAGDTGSIFGLERFPYVTEQLSLSVAQLCPALCDPMDCSTPGFSEHHQLLELVQTHVHQIGDTI